MQYHGIVTHEGEQTLVEFPDAPGCQTFADPGEDIHALAQEALESPDANLRLDTLERVAAAMGLHVHVDLAPAP